MNRYSLLNTLYLSPKLRVHSWNSSRSGATVGLLCFAASLSASGQAPTNATTKSTAPEEEPVSLSPFVISEAGNKYAFTGGPLKDLMLGGGVRDQDTKRTSTYFVNYPATYNLFARYVLNPHWSCQGNSDNLTDESYVITVNNPGLVQGSTRRTLRFSTRYTW